MGQQPGEGLVVRLQEKLLVLDVFPEFIRAEKHSQAL
jgi:hypothetical protein